MNPSLYQDAIVALAKTRKDDSLPDNKDGLLQLHQDNPLCGDSILLFAHIADNKIHLGQQTRGCILCEAAAARMMDLTNNVPRMQMQSVCESANTMFQTQTPIRELELFTPVLSRPARHDCVLLPFQALTRLLALLPPQTS